MPEYLLSQRIDAMMNKAEPPALGSYKLVNDIYLHLTAHSNPLLLHRQTP